MPSTRARWVPVLLSAVAPACGSFGNQADDFAPPTITEVDYVDPGLPPGDKIDIPEAVVGDYVDSGCSTVVVVGLSRQIADEMECANPGRLTEFEPGGGISFTTNALLPYLDPAALEDLRAVAAKQSIQINSAFRTIAQQYLLYQWYLRGMCGIPIAARPGNSNHETGRAVDLGNSYDVIDRMANHGWAWLGEGDPVHFDHLDSPDLRGSDVAAFQRLWNRNHPADKVPEDGVFGDMTAMRIEETPASGFLIGACGKPGAASTVRVDNGDEDLFTTSEKGWRSSTSIVGYDGEDYLVNDEGVPAWASWSFGLKEAGEYEVRVRFAPHANRNSRALYRLRLTKDGDAIEKRVDQRKAEGFATLGTYDLTTSATLSVDTTDADGYTVADAVVAEKK